MAQKANNQPQVRIEDKTVAENLTKELGIEMTAEVFGKLFGKAGQMVAMFLFDKATGKIRAEAKTYLFGNDAVIDGLFRRATNIAIAKELMTDEEERNYLLTLNRTISRSRLDDYRRLLVVSCFGNNDLKNQKEIAEMDLLMVLAAMIAADAKKAATDSHEPSGLWCQYIAFYNLDQSLEDVFDLEEIIEKNKCDIAKLDADWERFLDRVPFYRRLFS